MVVDEVVLEGMIQKVQSAVSKNEFALRCLDPQVDRSNIAADSIQKALHDLRNLLTVLLGMKHGG